MTIFQFLLIFWVRRALIISSTIVCLVGAVVICLFVPPQWTSLARVELNYVKSDLDTGATIGGNSMRFYIQTQQSLITDFAVASKAAELAGMFTDPARIRQYRNRSKDDQRDFPHFLADSIISNTKDDVINGTNILEINYSASTATGAQRMADALRRAYTQVSLDLARQGAQQNIDWYEKQKELAKQQLDKAQDALTAFERQNGIALGDKGVDLETSHLQTLAQQQAPEYLPNPPDQQTSASSLQLATVEAELASDLKTLGPNNPQVVELQTKETALKGMVARDRANSEAAAQRVLSGGAKAMAKAVAEQQAKVIQHGDVIARLGQLNQEVTLHRNDYNAAAEKVSHFRQLASSGDSGITSLGPALTPQAPVFPNWLLIVPGSIVLGLGVGVFAALLMELVGRRVRTLADLDFDDNLPVICTISGREVARARPSSGLLDWRNRWPLKRGAVGV